MLWRVSRYFLMPVNRVLVCCYHFYKFCLYICIKKNPFPLFQLSLSVIATHCCLTMASVLYWMAVCCVHTKIYVAAIQKYRRTVIINALVDCFNEFILQALGKLCSRPNWRHGPQALNLCHTSMRPDFVRARIATVLTNILKSILTVTSACLLVQLDVESGTISRWISTCHTAVDSRWWHLIWAVGCYISVMMPMGHSAV